MGEGTVNAGTWVPHSSNVPLYEGSGGLRPLVSAKGIHLWRTWARLRRIGPSAKSQGGPLELLQSRGRGWFLRDKLLQNGFPLSVSGGSFPHAHLPGSQCPPPEESSLSMPETGENERNCLFKSYTNLEE